MKNIITLVLVVFCMTAYAQETQKKVDYKTYMEMVKSQNIEYAAEKLNVNISEAEIIAAKVFNDVSLGVSYFNNSNWSMQMGQGGEVELSKTFTFGTRKARVKLAQSEKALTEALLADYFRNLQAEATIAFLEAIKQNELHKLLQDSYEKIKALAISDSIRHALGEITKVDAMQSRLEADLLHNELLQSETELLSAFAYLNLLTGTSILAGVLQPNATLQMPSRDFALTHLISTALENRTDIVAAMRNKEVAARAISLVKHERSPEIELFIAANRNARVLNEEAPAPAFTGFAAGVAIPLKFSAINKGEITAARIRQQQADMQYQQVELQIQTEVMQSYQRYQSLSQQVKRYEESLLENARQVVDGKLFSYNRGEVSLLEVLDAQRTYNEVQAQYIETLFSHAAALVELETSVGIWDVVM